MFFGLLKRSAAGMLVDAGPPPKKRYAWPSSSTSGAGSNFHATPSAPGVLPLISVLVRSLVHGPSGLSPVITLLEPPPLA